MRVARVPPHLEVVPPTPEHASNDQEFIEAVAKFQDSVIKKLTDSMDRVHSAEQLAKLSWWLGKVLLDREKLLKTTRKVASTQTPAQTRAGVVAYLASLPYESLQTLLLEVKSRGPSLP